MVGSGPIALSGHGSIVKISLEPNEEFLVDSRRLLAWDSILSPIPQSEIPAPRNPIKSAVSILSRVSRTSGSIARAAWDRISTSMANVTKKGKSSSGSEVESSTKSTSTTNSTSSFNSYFTADNIVKLKSVGVSSASFISNFAIKIFQSTQAKVFGKRVKKEGGVWKFFADCILISCQLNVFIQEMYQLKGPGEFYLSTGYDRYYTSELMMKIPQRVY